MESNSLPIKTDNIQIGDRIIIVFHKSNSFDKGEVKFIGEVSKGKGTWYGIALDEPKGKHSGKKYFTTKEKHGTFVTLRSLRKLVSEDFDMRAFKKAMRLEAEEMKKSKLRETMRKSKAPGGGRESTRPDGHNQGSDKKPAGGNTRSTMRGRTTMLARDDPAIGGKVKEIEKHYSELLQKKEKEIISLNGKLRSIEQKKNKEIAQLQKEIASGDASGLEDKLAESEEKMEALTIEVESLKQELEASQLKAEEADIKIQELEYDKEILLLQADLATDEQAEDLNPEELKQNYGYLKMAFTRLEEKYELEKEEWEIKMEELKLKYQGEDGSVLNNEEVKKTLNEKNKIIEELKERLEEFAETERYIESLTEQILNKDSALSQLDMDNKELKSSIEISEEIISELEEMQTLMTDEMTEKDDEIEELENKVHEFEQQKKEDEKTIVKYREKLRSIEGEIEIIKTQTSAAGGDDEDKVQRIDNLIKNYTACLQEKRGLVKSLVARNLEDIKEFKKQKKWSVILKSIPSKFVNQLNPMLLEKFFGLSEISERIQLILRHLRDNYLKTPIILEDNIGLVDFIVELAVTLLETQRLCEYMFDFGFHLEKFEEFKSVLRSNIFSMLKSSGLLLGRLLTEIREDTFSVKFNYNLMKDNNEKIKAFVTSVTNEYQELKNKDSIDMRTSMSFIEILYLSYYGYLVNREVSEERFEELTDKLKSINKNVVFDQSWAKAEARRQGNDEILDSKFAIGDFQKLEKLLLDNREALTAEGADVKQAAESVYESVRNFSIKFGKKIRIDDEDRQLLLTLLANNGPWQENVKTVMDSLELFDQLNKENLQFKKKVDELKLEVNAREQRIENHVKVKSNMESRIKDLELRCNNLPFLENEKARLQEKERHLSDAYKRLQEENENLKKKADEAIRNARNNPKPIDQVVMDANNPLAFKKAQEAFKNMKKVRYLKGNVRKPGHKDYSFREKFEIFTLDSTIKKLINQLMGAKTKRTSETLQNVRNDMPNFNRYLNKQKNLKEKELIKQDAVKTIQRVKTLTNAVKKSISQSKLIDCSEAEGSEETSIARILRLNKLIKRQETGVRSSMYRANLEVSEFRSRWARHQLDNNRMIHVGANAQEIAKRMRGEAVGRVQVGDRILNSKVSKKRVVFDYANFDFAQALRF